MSTYYSACDIRDVTPNYCQRLTYFVYISILIFYSKQAGPITCFIFLSIFKSLQVKIQACFSSQALPISFIQHSTAVSNY